MNEEERVELAPGHVLGRDNGFFYVEWRGEPCPWCGENGVSGKSPGGHFFAGCPDPDCLAHNLAYDFVTVDHARAAWNTRASPQGVNTVSEAGERVREVIAETGGVWRSCSGCYETSDGQNVNGYPHSSIFGCIQGSGCSECGGLGVVWDDTDYKAMGRELAAAPTAPVQDDDAGWLRQYPWAHGRPIWPSDKERLERIATRLSADHTEIAALKHDLERSMARENELLNAAARGDQSPDVDGGER